MAAIIISILPERFFLAAIFGAAHVFTDFISDGNMSSLSFIPRLKTYPGIFRSPALPCSTPAISHQGQEYGQ